MATFGSTKNLFFEMLKQHRQGMSEAKRQRTKKIKPAPRRFPLGIANNYFKTIRNWIKVFTDIVDRELEFNLENWILTYNLEVKGDSLNLRSDSYSTEFKAFIDSLYDEETKQFVLGIEEKRAIVSVMGQNISDFHNTQWQKDIKKVLGVYFYTAEPWEKEVIATWAETNMTLIKSLSDEYIKKVNTIVSTGVQGGLNSKELKKEIKGLNSNISNYRAELIAQDQVSKLRSNLSQRRQQELDLDLYYWITAADERVRKTHASLDGTINRWEDSSVYSNDGITWNSRTAGMTKVHPGRDVRCRCDAPAFFDELIELVDQAIHEDMRRSTTFGTVEEE